VVSSHILTELAEMCTTIGIVERGRLLYAGSIREAYERARGGERIAVRLENGVDGDRRELHARAVAALEADSRVAAARAEEDQLLIDLAPGVQSHHFLIEA